MPGGSGNVVNSWVRAVFNRIILITSPIKKLLKNAFFPDTSSIQPANSASAPQNSCNIFLAVHDYYSIGSIYLFLQAYYGLIVNGLPIIVVFIGTGLKVAFRIKLPFSSI
jgi:hypothetical protein